VNNNVGALLVQDYTIFGERERKAWSDAAVVNSYVKYFGPIADEVAPILVERAAAPGRSVLDLCCGQGRLTAMLGAAGAKIAGVDFSKEMLALAAKAAPDATLKEGDAADLPFDDDAFDAVVCNFGMMHLPDQPRALTEVRRVLRPGGRYVMATWVGPQASPAFAAVFGAMKAHADFSAAPPQPDLFAFADPSIASEMLGEAGLSMTSHDVVTPAWQVSAPEELFEIFRTATVAAAMLIRSQKPDVIAAIRDQIAATVAAKHADGAGYRIPVPVAVIAAEA
jgi:SAM-dependent methyltransferase